MEKCPKCLSEQLKGRYCGSCGYPVILVSDTVSDECEEQSQCLHSEKTVQELEIMIQKSPDDLQLYSELIGLFIKGGEYEKAYSTFRAAKALAPDEMTVLRDGAALLELLNRKKDAIELLTKVVKAEPTDRKSVMKLSELLYDCGQKKEALECLKKYEKIHDDDPDLIIKIAQAYLSLSEHDNAQRYLSKYKRMVGTNREMFLMLGQTMLARGFYDGALKNFLEAVTACPNDYKMRLGLGKAYNKMGERGKALLEFEQALKLNPESSETVVELAMLQNILGISQQVDSTLNKLDKFDDVSADSYLDLAKHFLEHKMFDKAIKYLQTAQTKNQYHPEVQQTLSDIYFQQGKYGSAMEIYKKVLENNSQCIWALKGTVQCAEQTEEFELKSISQKKLLDITAPTCDAWCDYGETLIRLGFFNQAQDAFEEAARLDPSSVRAYQAPELIQTEKLRSEGEKFYQQAKQGLEQKLYLSAAERLEKAISQVPGQMEWTKLLAEVSVKTADISKASILLSKVQAKQPGNYKTGFHLAKVYEHENKTQLAIELLSSVVKDHPLELDAHLALLRLKRGQIRGYKAEFQMLDTLVRNLDLELSHLRQSSPVPLLVNAYANYIFSYQTKFEQKALARAEETFKEVLRKFGDIEDALRGLCLISRLRSDSAKAVDYSKAIVKISTEPSKLAQLARLHENFHQYSEARKCYSSLKNLYPENGHYRRKVIEMTAELTKSGSKNELMNLISSHHESIQSKKENIWLLYETALAYDYMADFSTRQDEFIKKSLLNWHKLVNHPRTNHWIRWMSAECQLKRLKGADKHRAATNNLKECEKILRSMPDSALAYLYVAKCILGFDDLTSKDRAMEYLDKSWFLSRENYDTAKLYAQTAKDLAKFVIVDSISHNMILLEPEMVLTLI